MKSAVYILFETPFICSRGKFFIDLIVFRILIKISSRTVVMLDINDLNTVLSCDSNQFFNVFPYYLKCIQSLVKTPFLCVYNQQYH